MTKIIMEIILSLLYQAVCNYFWIAQSESYKVDKLSLMTTLVLLLPMTLYLFEGIAMCLICIVIILKLATIYLYESLKEVSSMTLIF